MDSTRSRSFPIELAVIGYLAAYLPYVIATRYIATVPSADGAPVTGLEILPTMLITGGVATLAFIVLAGWMRAVHRVKIGPVRIPLASKWTALSGVATALILTTVPLSYTFRDASIPFMQLLMRGDILIIAPLVDLLSRRRVHWWSWAALALVAVALVITLGERGGLKLHSTAIATIVVYTAGYFGRLWIMSKVAKDDDPEKLRRFFSEEKIVAFPAALIFLGLIALFARGTSQGAELAFGFTEMWSQSAIWFIAFCGLTICLTGVFSAFILLDPRENSYCVPLERSASILAGIFGSVLLASFADSPMPSAADLTGGVILIGAILVLWIGPRLRRGATHGVAEDAS
jgi:hypothetical protein